jgi:hypothetical protein
MKAKLAWAVALLTACGGSGQSPEQARTERARARATEAAGDVAGGETSESRVAIEPCLEIVSSEPLDLDDPEVASWVAMAQGHHEQTLGWRRLVLSDEVAGFAEHTSVSIDVNVLGGRNVLYGSGSNTDNEVVDCVSGRARQIELEVTLATADGAMAPTFRAWFEPAPTDDRGMVLSHYGPTTDGSGGPVDLNGTLELGPDPALGGTPGFWVWLEFGADSVQGSLDLEVMPEVGDREGSPWWPIEAHFPDDGCAREGRSIGLDKPFEAIGGTPRAYYHLMAARRTRIPATWRSKPSNVQASPSDVPLDLPPPTEVSLYLGEPTLACAFGTSLTMYAPLTVTTADGRVNLTQPFGFSMYGASTYIVEWTPWVPAPDFDEQMGIDGVNLPSGYGSISVELTWSPVVEGRIEVNQWDAFRVRAAAYPVLEW